MTYYLKTSVTHLISNLYILTFRIHHYRHLFALRVIKFRSRMMGMTQGSCLICENCGYNLHAIICELCNSIELCLIYRVFKYLFISADSCIINPKFMSVQEILQNIEMSHLESHFANKYTRIKVNVTLMLYKLFS